MPDFKQGNVIRVPFPYTDRSTREYRPALVVSAGGIGPDNALLWVAMITSAKNKPWECDVAIADLQGAGLPAASVVRTSKIATIEAVQAEYRGTVSAPVLQAVRAHLLKNLG